MLKISQQAREAYICMHANGESWFCTEVRDGLWDKQSDMQALEAFRRETLDEAKEVVIGYDHPRFPNLIAPEAIEDLKEPKP